jgi:hypothetical protein
VRGEERAGSIEDHPSCLQGPQLVQTALGTIEGRPHVEPAESDIAGTKPPGRLLWREDDRIEAEGSSGAD